MTFEAYSVAMRLRLVDMVTPVLGIISSGMRSLNKDTEAAKRNVSDLEKRLQSIKTLALTGGAMMGAGLYGLSLFEAPMKAAREYELAFTKFKTLNLGETVNKQADQFARSANLMGVSARELMETMGETVGLFGSYYTAQRLAPKIAALNAANSAIFQGKIGTIDEGASRSLAKFIDRRGGTHDEATFMRNLDLAQRLVTGSGGFIKFRDLDQFSQQAGTAFRGLSDAGILNMALLLQEQGGSRAGTSWMSLYQNLIAGRTPKKTMAMLQEYGLGHLSMETHATVGGKALKSMVMRDIKGADLLMANPPEWFRTVFLPALASHGITSEAAILKAANDLLSNRTGSSQGSIMSTQLLQIMRDANLAKNAMGYEQTIEAWKNDPNAKWAELTARWTDTLRELGLVVLPTAIKGLEGLTGVLKTVSSLSRDFPHLTGAIVLTGAALSGLTATGGALMLFRAGLSGLGLALGAGGAAAGAGGGLLAAVTGLLGPIGLAVAGVTALAAVLGLLKPGQKDDGKDHKDEHWERNHLGRGGEWVKNTRVVGARRGYMGSMENWVSDPDGGGHWQPVNVVPPASRPPVTINNKIVMPNGRVLAEVVTKEQTKEVTRPLTGISGFDGRQQLTPAGGGF